MPHTELLAAEGVVRGGCLEEACLCSDDKVERTHWVNGTHSYRKLPLQGHRTTDRDKKDRPHHVPGRAGAAG